MFKFFKNNDSKNNTKNDKKVSKDSPFDKLSELRFR